MKNKHIKNNESTEDFIWGFVIASIMWFILLAWILGNLR
jgi:arginine exporter protein ArgO